MFRSVFFPPAKCNGHLEKFISNLSVWDSFILRIHLFSQRYNFFLCAIPIYAVDERSKFILLVFLLLNNKFETFALALNSQRSTQKKKTVSPKTNILRDDDREVLVYIGIFEIATPPSKLIDQCLCETVSLSRWLASPHGIPIHL